MLTKSEIAAVFVNDLQFSYPGEESAVISVPSLAIEAGKKLVLYGESGCGKSTLLHLLSGLLKPQSGSVAIADTVLSACSARQRDRFRARHIGLVYQQFNLIPYLSGVDNILLAAVMAGMKKNDAFEKAECLLAAMGFSKKLMQNPTEQLSLGQQQRVAIARALVKTPALLLMDEPTSALDNVNTDKFMSLLMSMLDSSKQTLLLVTHDHRLEDYFDQSMAFNAINTGAV